MSALWGEILADALGITVHRLAEPEYTNARGAALLAFGVLGRLDLDAGRLPAPDRGDASARPASGPPTYAWLRERFAGFHAATRSWYRAAARRSDVRHGVRTNRASGRRVTGSPAR